MKNNIKNECSWTYESWIQRGQETRPDKAEDYRGVREPKNRFIVPLWSGPRYKHTTRRMNYPIWRPSKNITSPTLIPARKQAYKEKIGLDHRKKILESV